VDAVVLADDALAYGFFRSHRDPRAGVGAFMDVIMPRRRRLTHQPPV
jgi:hypothetical protein